MRSRYAMPQSSASHRLKARNSSTTAPGPGLPPRLVHGPAVGFATEVVGQCPRRCDGVEGRIGDGPADAAAEGVVAPAAGLDPFDHPWPERRVEVAGERIE